MGERIGKHRKRETTGEQYVAFLARAIDGLGERMADDPALIAFGKDLQERLSHSLNIGLVRAQERHKATGEGYSLRDLGKLAGTSHVAVLDRIKRGRIELAAREARLGVVRLSEARKPSVPAIREQRAEALRAAGVPDLKVLRTA